MSEQLELFRDDFLWYHQDAVLVADYNDKGQLVVMVNPFINFEQVVLEVCDCLSVMVSFNARLDILIYPFGRNECFTLVIN